MSANLFTRFVDVDDFARVLNIVDPDLLVTVEMTPEAAEVARAYYEHHFLSPDPGYSGWGIASHYKGRFWPEPQWRGGRAEIDLDGTPVHLAATHINDPIFGRWSINREKRRQQVDSLLSWSHSLPEDEPQLVAGDMNASPAWEVYKRLAGRWDDLVVDASAGKGERPARTWGPGIRLLRIDHVFGSHLRGVAASVERIRGSDHSAVVVDLELL